MKKTQPLLEADPRYPDGTRIRPSHTYKKILISIQKKQGKKDEVLCRIRKALDPFRKS